MSRSLGSGDPPTAGFDAAPGFGALQDYEAARAARAEIARAAAELAVLAGSFSLGEGETETTATFPGSPHDESGYCAISPLPPRLASR